MLPVVPYPLRVEKNSTPCPQYRILVPLGGSFQNFRRAPQSFYMGVPPRISGLRLDSCWDHEIIFYFG